MNRARMRLLLIVGVLTLSVTSGSAALARSAAVAAPSLADFECDVSHNDLPSPTRLTEARGRDLVLRQPVLLVFVHGFDAWSASGRRDAASLRGEFAPLVAAVSPGANWAGCYLSWDSQSGFLAAGNALDQMLALMAEPETPSNAPADQLVLIFGFSAGGHLVKSAMVRAAETGALDHLRHAGFVTLGPPHRGTPLAVGVQDAANVARTYLGQWTDDPNLGSWAQAAAREAARFNASAGLRDLSPEAVNPALADLNAQFLPVAARATYLNICSRDDPIAPPATCELPLAASQQIMLQGFGHWGFTRSADPSVLQAVSEFADAVRDGTTLP